ncbi:PQQ-binding-like beta-propeller repeat protein [Brevibacillus massiliensis]|uniref:outer membrane protein assembly factor BamB family protein n=2 Tax=Brevibacillus massiliensis TaxID=1118054 RepID=UPI001FE0E978|nr:PQQ-binding-like beta-propeller repeat protein [Brevibacillus massiliensis]
MVSAIRKQSKMLQKTRLALLGLACAAPLFWGREAAAEVGQVQWERTYKYLWQDNYNNFQHASDGSILFSRKNGNQYEIVRVDKAGKLRPEVAVPSEKLRQLTGFAKTGDGGYLLSGLIPASGYDRNIRLVRVDQDGQVKWDKTITGSGYEYAQAVRQTADGNIVLLGRDIKLDDEYRYNGDIYLAKVDPAGQTIWEIRHETGGNTTGQSLVETPDGRLVVAGNERTISHFREGIGLGYLLKVDQAGEKVWEKTLPGDTRTSGIRDIQLTKDGHLLVSGYVLYNDINMNASKSDEYVACLDQDGNSAWEKVFSGGEEHREGYLIQSTADEGCLAVGLEEKNYSSEWVLHVNKLKGGEDE